VGWKYSGKSPLAIQFRGQALPDLKSTRCQLNVYLDMFRRLHYVAHTFAVFGACFVSRRVVFLLNFRAQPGLLFTGDARAFNTNFNRGVRRPGSCGRSRPHIASSRALLARHRAPRVFPTPVLGSLSRTRSLP
jgi:hypothetical protein